tara:strand:+ start:230 stop:1162 length:933 start_codon:yes stop_codon:yes gene_type:complete
MRIIVTGGFGFIGSEFVNTIGRKNPTAEVLVIDNLTYAANARRVNVPNIDFLEKDICDVTVEDLGSYDYLVHFAAESHVDNSIKDGKPFIRTNVEGTFNLLECARQNKSLKKFIHISTDEVYGDMADISIDVTADEEFPLVASSYYSATKASSDMLVLSAARTFGLPYIITRTCNNYGENQHSEKFIPTIMRSIKEGKKIPVYGDGQHVREWIDVTDNTQLIYEIMLSDRINETFNIGSGERYTNLEIIDMIGTMMNKNPEYEFVADRLGHDKRYALNSGKLNSILGETIPLSFEEYLLEQVYNLKQEQL